MRKVYLWLGLLSGGVRESIPMRRDGGSLKDGFPDFCKHGESHRNWDQCHLNGRNRGNLRLEGLGLSQRYLITGNLVTQSFVPKCGGWFYIYFLYFLSENSAPNHFCENGEVSFKGKLNSIVRF